MKSKKKLLQWGWLFVLTLSTIRMNAQDTTSLSAAEQGLIHIAALTATGNQEQLKIQLNTALDAGLTINEIKEAMVQLYAYCGFPRSLNALGTFEKVLLERKAGGKTDAPGKPIVTENEAKDKYEQGRVVLEQLTNTKQVKPAPGFGEFAPRVDAFLKEHLFADIFSSDVLSYKQRELVTISALAAMTGVTSQLQSHINMGKNTGITQDQLLTLSQLIKASVNVTQANIVRNIISAPPLPVVGENMIVRLTEIEIVPEYREQYMAILKEEAAASVKVEPGVISIYPMYQKEHPEQIRIVEIYASKNAYESHIKSPHFQHYKTSTLKMVKSLKLVDMQSIDQQAMGEIFNKLK